MHVRSNSYSLTVQDTFLDSGSVNNCLHNDCEGIDMLIDNYSYSSPVIQRDNVDSKSSDLYFSNTDLISSSLEILPVTVIDSNDIKVPLARRRGRRASVGGKKLISSHVSDNIQVIDSFCNLEDRNEKSNKNKSRSETLSNSKLQSVADSSKQINGRESNMDLFDAEISNDSKSAIDFNQLQCQLGEILQGIYERQPVASGSMKLNSSTFPVLIILSILKKQLNNLDYVYLLDYFCSWVIKLSAAPQTALLKASNESDTRVNNHNHNLQKTNKSISFVSVDGSCVSPPNDRRPQSWHSTYNSLQQLLSLVTFCKDIKSHSPSASECVSEVFQLLLTNPESMQAIFDTVKSEIELFGMNFDRQNFAFEYQSLNLHEVRVSLRMFTDELKTPSQEETNTRSRCSWIASSIVKFHLRWLLDPLPAEISVPSATYSALLTAYRSNFYTLTDLDEDILLNWIKLLDINDAPCPVNNLKDNKKLVPTLNPDPKDVTVSFVFNQALQLLHLLPLISQVDPRLAENQEYKTLTYEIEQFDLTNYVESQVRYLLL